MFDRIKAARAKAAEERAQRIKEENERIERELQEEKNRLMTLSDKELLVEMIVEMKRTQKVCERIKDKCEDIETSCDDISFTVRQYSN